MARPNLFRNRKFVRLSRLLGATYKAVGVLEMVWQHAYSDGNPVLGSPEDVEFMAGWDGEPGVCSAALVDAGFLDVDEATGNLSVHDLTDHEPDYVRKRRLREAQRRPCQDDDQTVTGQCPDNGGQQPPNGRPPSPSPSPTPTRNTEEPPLTPPAGGESAPKKKVSPYTEEFEVYFWRPYPRKIGKRKAFSAYGKAKKRPEWPGCDRLRDSVIEHTASEQWQKDGGQYIPLPETYLNQSRWEDEVTPARSRVPDADVGKHVPPQWGYSDADREKYRTHPQWEPYLDECAEALGWGGEMGEWPGFEEWLAERGESA